MKHRGLFDREAGIKGMKWGSRKDAELDKKLSSIADHASDEGMTGSASKIEAVQRDAAKEGHYTGDHLESLANHADSHDEKGRSASSGSAQEEFHTNMAERLGDAIDEYHEGKDEAPGDNRPIYGDRFMKDKGKESKESDTGHVSPKDQEPTPKEGYVDKRYGDLKSGMESRHRKTAPRVMESNRQRFPREAAIDLREFYAKPAKRNSSNSGWKNGVSFTPTAPKAQNEEVNLIIKEF